MRRHRRYGCEKMLKHENLDAGPLPAAAAEAPARPRDADGSGSSAASERKVPSAAAADAEAAAAVSAGPVMEKFLKGGLGDVSGGMGAERLKRGKQLLQSQVLRCESK